MKKKAFTINLLAGPGCGKSTTAAGIFSILKMHGVNAELITEFAKDLTWEKRFNTLENQSYIWAKQHHKMWRVKDQVDVMVTDCPLVMGLVYGVESSSTGYMKETILRSFQEFNNINYFLERKKKYNPAGRVQTEEKAKQLDGDIKKMLIKNDIEFGTTSADFSGINNIASDVLALFHKKIKIHLKEI